MSGLVAAMVFVNAAVDTTMSDRQVLLIVEISFVVIGLGIWFLASLSNRKSITRRFLSKGLTSERTSATRPNREADHRTGIRRFPFAGIPTFGAPETGDDGTLDALIRARRFREASAKLSSSDLSSRGRLAITRLGPPSDLYRVARSPKRSKERHAARTILSEFNRHLGYRLPHLSTFPFDPVENRCALLERRIRKGWFRNAAHGYERLIRKYPKGDETPDWILSSALAFALARRRDDARRLALSTTGFSDSHPAKDSASRFLRNLERDKGGASLHLHRKSYWLAFEIEGSQKRKHLPEYPRWPNQVEHLGWRNAEIEIARLTQENVAAVIDTGAIALVGLSNGPRIYTRAIGAISPELGVVSVSDGRLYTWDDLTHWGIWGKIMVVVRPKKTKATWETIPREEAFMGPPLKENYERAHDAAAVATMREMAGRLPDDPAVAYAFLWCLDQTPVEQALLRAKTEEVLTEAAVARLRFGKYVWAHHFWAWAADNYMGDRDVRSLAVLDSLGRTVRTVILERALAHAQPSLRGHHLREAALLTPSYGPIFGLLLDMAERHGDVDEYESIFDYTRATFPRDSEAPHYKRTLLVIKHGPRGAFPLVTKHEGESEEVVAQVRASLAAHAVDAEMLDTAERELVAVKPGDPRAPLCRVYAALHRADAATALAQLEESAKRDGIFQQSVLALLDIATGLVPSVQGGAVLMRAEPYMTAFPGHIRTLVVESRTTHLWREGLELGRRLVRAKVLPGWGETTQVEGILQAIAKTAPEARGALVEEGFQVLGGIPAGEWGPLPTFMEVALEVHRDPDRAWTLLQDAKVESVPLISFALAAEIAARQGEVDRVQVFQTRMTNPDLIVQGMTIASRLGLVNAVEGAVANLDPDLFPHAVYDLYGAGGKVPRLPTVPTPDYPRISFDLLDRLGRNAAWSHLTHLAAVRFQASSLLNFYDGALGASLCALARAGEGDPSELSAMAERSRHPAVLRALMMAEANQLGFEGSRALAAQHSPGAVEAFDFAESTS